MNPPNDAAVLDGLNKLGLTDERELRPTGANVSFMDADSGFSPEFQDGYRLLGFDAPEVAHASNNFTAEPLAYMARDELARQVEQSGGARLEDSGEVDPYGRSLAVLRGNDGRNVNAELARTGLVNSPRYQPEAEYRDALRGANWRTSTDAGNILQGADATLNEQVKAAQAEIFRAREEGRMAPFVKQNNDLYGNVSTWNRAWTRGVHNTAATFDGFAAAIGDVTGSDAVREWGEEGAAERIRRAAEFPAKIESWDDVETLDQFGTFALEALGSNLPQLGIDAAAFALTGGSGLAVRAGFAKALARELPEGALVNFAANAGKAGAMGSIYAQSAGETALGLQQQGVEGYGSTALLTGIPKAALEYAPLDYAFRNLMRSGRLTGAQAGQAFSRALAVSGAEATTEGMQTVLDFMAQKYHTGEDVFSDENVRELKTAVAAGAIVGGTFGSVAAIPPAYRALRDRYFRPEIIAPEDTPVGPAPRMPDIDMTDRGDVITAREPIDDVNAQIAAFQSGRKPAMYLSRANEDSFAGLRAAADGARAQVIETPEGLLVTHVPIDERAYLDAAPADRDAIRTSVLGYTQNKADIDPDNAVVVQTRDADGNIIQQEVTDVPEAAVTAQEQMAGPTDTVEVVDVQAPIIERTERNNEQFTDDPAGAVPVQSEQLSPSGDVENASAVAAGVDSGIPGEVGAVEQPGEPTYTGDVADGLRQVLSRQQPAGTTARNATAGAGRVGAVRPSTPGVTATGAVAERDTADRGDVAVRGERDSTSATQPAIGGSRQRDWSGELTARPRVALGSLTAADLREYTQRLATEGDSLRADVQALRDRGLSAIEALSYALAADRTTDMADPDNGTGDVIDEDEITEATNLSTVDSISQTDLDAYAPNRAGQGHYFGTLAELHQQSFEAMHPTWEMRKVRPVPDAQGRERHQLATARRTFSDKAAAEAYAAQLGRMYAGEVFIPREHQVPDPATGMLKPTGEFYLSRHKLDTAVSGDFSTDPLRTWLHVSVPKIKLNASGARHGRAAAQRVMNNQRVSEKKRQDARLKFLMEDAKLLYMHEVDLATGKRKAVVEMHAPTITELGKELIQDMDNASPLERDFAAFSAGLGALWRGGYRLLPAHTKNAGRMYSPDIAFTPEAMPATMAEVQRQRSELLEQTQLIPQLQRRLYHLLARQRQVENTRAGMGGQQLGPETYAEYLDQSLSRDEDRIAAAITEARDTLNAAQSLYGEIAYRTYKDGTEGEFVDTQNSRNDLETTQTASHSGYMGRDSELWQPGDGDQQSLDQRVGATPDIPGLSRQELERGITAFMREFPGAGVTKVRVESVQDTMTAEPVAARYNPVSDTLTVYASVVPDIQALRSLLQHELLVHKGFGFLTSVEVDEALGMLRDAIRSDARVQRIYNDVAALYDGEPQHILLEETFAFIAEGLDTGLIPRTWNRIVAAVRAVLRRIGLLKDKAGLAEVEQLLQDIARAMASGMRPANRGSVRNRELHRRITMAGFTPASIARAARGVAAGMRKLALPMTNGLYQLHQISPSAAAGFRRYWALRDRTRALWEGEFQNRVNMSQEEVAAAWRELVDRGETTDLAGVTPNAMRLRRFLDSFYDRYAKQAMPTLGRIPNYVPQIVDVRQLPGRKDEFIDLLVRHGHLVSGDAINKATATEIYNRLVSNSGVYENSLDDYAGVVAPGNDHRHARFLRSPELIAAMEANGFMYADKREAIEHYLTTSINRGAFETTFGGMRAIKGWQSPNGQYNYKLLEQLFTSAGRQDLLERNLPAGDLADLAVQQGYAERVMGVTLNGPRTLSEILSGDPHVAYMVLSELARRSGDVDAIIPESLVTSAHDYARHLRAAGVHIPTAFRNFRVTEQLMWYAPTRDLHYARLAVAPEQRRRMDEIVHGFMGYFGSRVSPEVHRWQSNIMAYESVLTLAFSTLSSLPDFAGPFLRIMRDEGVATALQSLVSAMRNIRGYEQTRQMARDFGFINHRQTQAALKAMWGQEHYSPTAQKVLDGLFKYNGQEWLTNQSRIFSAGVGAHYFETMARAGNDAALARYGLNAAQVQRWLDMGQQPYTLDVMEQGGVIAADAEALHNALHKFVDESIIRPNAGQRPVWANDPRFALFWHLKSFLWAYWSVIVSPVGRSIIDHVNKGRYGEAAGQMAFTGLALLPLAALGWEIRQLIQYSLFDEEQPSEDMDMVAYFEELISRSGMAGPFQLAFDAFSQDSMDGGIIRISGPTLGHVWTLLHGDWDEKLYRSTPVLGQLYGAQSVLSD